MFGRLGVTEVLIILAVGFLIFGPKRLSQLGKSFGETIREFRKAAKDTEDTISHAMEDSEEEKGENRD